ncbi:MAG: hypothetical protein K6A94_07090 [Bacteroidales bacterium]|nr:hypothetical protein [Bacteroidales bacterium]
MMKSPASLKGIIEYIDSKENEKIWNIDLDCYTNENIKLICTIYNGLSKKLESIEVQPTITLVTKIMLGVFGCVPALDSYFCIWARKEFDSCRFRVFNHNVLKCFSDFYLSNKTVFDSINIHTIDFQGRETNLTYTKAKLLDMFGFSMGENG